MESLGLAATREALSGTGQYHFGDTMTRLLWTVHRASMKVPPLSPL